MPKGVSGGVLFGPTVNGKSYLSLNQHRGSNPHKSQWLPSFTRDEEFALFDHADAQVWSDSKDQYWAVRDGGELLGTNEERVAKYPLVRNARDPWHGYPVSPAQKGSGDAPPDELIERWHAEDIVSRTFARRLEKWRI